MGWKWIFPFIVVLAISVFFALGKDDNQRGKENLYYYFEKLAEAESVFYNTLESILALESLEKELLEEMLELEENEAAKLIKKKEQAISFAKERNNKIDKSTQKMFEVYEELDDLKIHEINLKEEKLKKVASQLLALAKERKNLFMKLTETYNNATLKDIEVYNLIADFESTSSEVETTLYEVKMEYDELVHLEVELGEKTKEFLEKKQEYYELIGNKRKK